MRKIYEFLGKIEAFVASIFLVAIVILVFTGGVARFFHNPISWANPLASFLFAWASMLAMDMAYRKDKLMNVDLLVKRFSKRIQGYIKIFNYLLIFTFLIYLIIFGFKLAIVQKYRTFEGIYGFSYMWATLSIPCGAIFLLITTLVKIIDEIKGLQNRRN
jgi:TRAP-type C4-dicarboxylate transport system permease small subunit